MQFDEPFISSQPLSIHNLCISRYVAQSNCRNCDELERVPFQLAALNSRSHRNSNHRFELLEIGSHNPWGLSEAH